MVGRDHQNIEGCMSIFGSGLDTREIKQNKIDTPYTKDTSTYPKSPGWVRQLLQRLVRQLLQQAAAAAGAMPDSENVSHSKLIPKKYYLPAFAAITSASYIAALAKSFTVQLELSVTR